MKNCAKEVHPNDWFNKEYATYGNKQNTFTSNKRPEILDYIFKGTNSLEKVGTATTSFSLPLFTTGVSMTGMSLSDHESIATSIYIWKLDRY